MMKEEAPKTTKTVKAFTARLPSEMVDRLDQIAEENHWSRATAIKVILKKELTVQTK